MRDKRRSTKSRPASPNVRFPHHRHHRPPQRRQVDAVQPADGRPYRARLGYAGADARPARRRSRSRRQSRDHRRHGRPRAGQARLDCRAHAPAERSGARRVRSRALRRRRARRHHLRRQVVRQAGPLIGTPDRPRRQQERKPRGRGGLLCGVRARLRRAGRHFRRTWRGPGRPRGRDDVGARAQAEIQDRCGS